MMNAINKTYVPQTETKAERALPPGSPPDFPVDTLLGTPDGDGESARRTILTHLPFHKTIIRTNVRKVFSQ